MFFKNLFSKSKKSIDIETCFPDGILFVSMDGTIYWSNDKIAKMLSLSKRNLSGIDVNYIISNSFTVIKEAANRKTPAILKVNENLYFEISSQALDEGFVVLLRDNTHNYQTMTNLIANHDFTQKVNVDKNNFLLKLSNEIKSPIHSIIGFSQAMIDGLGGEMSEKQDKYVKIINKNSTELMYLVDKLLELSSSECLTENQEVQKFDIINAIQTVIKLNESLIVEKKLNVPFSVSEDIQRTISTNEKSFKSIIQNLLETAIKATDIGSVQINLTMPDEEFLVLHGIKNVSVPHFLVSLNDSGVGMTQSDIETLFDPYSQADKSNKKSLIRSIVMACSKNMALSLDAVVWVEAKPMNGTTYSLLIPCEKVVETSYEAEAEIDE